MRDKTTLLILFFVGIFLFPLKNSSAASFKPIVHPYSATEKGIFVNAYLIETEHNVVAIDSTLTVSDSKALREKLKSLKKPLVAVLLTHGHPDHYNGVAQLVASKKVPIVSTSGVERVIRENDAAKEKQWAPVFGEEWPKKRSFPNKTVKDQESLLFDNVTFTVHDLGSGESQSDSYWIMESNGEKYAFIGDEVLNQVHAYLSDGYSTEWLKNLDQLKNELQGVSLIYPGHGEAGRLEMIDWQKKYISKFRKEVKKLSQGKSTLTPEAKKKLEARMKRFLPNEKLSFLIPLGGDAVAKELNSENQK